jgi:hypothetical protein
MYEKCLASFFSVHKIENKRENERERERMIA